MKRNNIILNKQNFNLSLLRLLLLFGVFGMFISCEVEDDMPPPSAWVEPEPVEGCVQLVGVPEISEGIDFECEYPEIVVFGEAAGSITIEPADNPDNEGINTSDKVMMVTQTSGVEGWAGFSFVLDSKVDFSEKQTIKVKVYSPAEDQTILLKLEDKTDSSISKEVPATTTVANEWEELSFVFSPGDSDKFDRLVLFFNFNGDKDGATVHYFDDIVQVEGGSTQEPGGSPDPTSAPPAPTAAAGDVQSIFSDSYTDPAGV
ncbi:MAG: carbohydrate binding domain-containing protein, partial [Salinimicrobium sediminis]|nr:carbohydrate binding domain-containing protein [Salinimicrobium sediminis]